MKTLILTLFLGTVACIISCQKDKTPMPLNESDIREQYKGLFYIRISHSYRSFDFPPNSDTSYHTIVKIDYKASDSITYTVQIPENKYFMMPALYFYDTVNKRFVAKLGIDSNGKIHGSFNTFGFYGGGFINSDSINCFFGADDNHSYSEDSLVGYRIK